MNLIRAYKNGELNTINLNTIDIHVQNEKAFRFACRYGYFEIVKLLIKIDDTQMVRSNEVKDRMLNEVKDRISLNDLRKVPINIHANNEEAFIEACSNGHCEIVKFIINIADERKSPINIHVQNEEAFLQACEKNYTDVVKLLILYGEKINSPINIHVQNEKAFRFACEHGNYEMAKWLFQLSIEKKDLINVHIWNRNDIRIYSRNYLHIVKWLLTLYSKEALINLDHQFATEELQNRKKIKLHLFIYLLDQEKFKKLLDMNAINIVYDYL